jgi:hypothetical protein
MDKKSCYHNNNNLFFMNEKVSKKQKVQLLHGNN